MEFSTVSFGYCLYGYNVTEYARKFRTFEGQGYDPSITVACTYPQFCRALSVLLTLLYATGVNPEVFQVVLPGPFSAEPDLLIARLILASAICQVFESDLRRIRSPCV